MDDPVETVRVALAEGKLGSADLTARQLGAYLGKTTSVLYHHWGSLDGFLFAVSQAGFAQLTEELLAVRDGGLVAVAEAFVTFGLDSPALYALMFERRYDWSRLREAGTFAATHPGGALWAGVVEQLRGAGANDPEGDARILFAGLHGLVSLALSGRANVGAIDVSDREVALETARKLARRICP